MGDKLQWGSFAVCSLVCSSIIVLAAVATFFGYSPFHISERLPNLDLVLSFLKFGILPFVVGLYSSMQASKYRLGLVTLNLLYLPLALLLLVIL